MIGVRERVRGIRVDHEGKVGKVLARGFGDLHLEARLDLQLDALVSTFELAADRLHQRVDRRLDTDGDAAKDPVARSPEEGRERLVRAFREEVPDCHLHGRLRHAVLANPDELSVDILDRGEVGLQELREDELLERVKHRSPRLARIPGQLSCNALAPSDRSLRLDAAEHARHVCLARAARLVRVLQREAHHEELDSLKFHRGFAPVKPSPASRRGSAPAPPGRGWGTSKYAPRPSVARRNSTAA